MAYKRTISRLGRWPWDTFDDSYSNAFSHGKAGGNVRGFGVAGAQRQQKIDATGWVGSQHVQFLPERENSGRLPHAGEYGMDAKAQSLLVDAWNTFHGAPKPAQTR